MWTQMREAIIASFPAAPGLPQDQEENLNDVEDIYLTDAYHSLSIEGYRVTSERIIKMSSGKLRNAMAARGYFLTFQSVKETIKAILTGKNAGEKIDTDQSR